jgi:hypothetical protein
MLKLGAQNWLAGAIPLSVFWKNTATAECTINKAKFEQW